MTARTELDGVIGGRPREVESEQEPTGADPDATPEPRKTEAP